MELSNDLKRPEKQHKNTIVCIFTTENAEQLYISSYWNRPMRDDDHKQYKRLDTELMMNYSN